MPLESPSDCPLHKKSLRWGRIILASVIFTVVSQVIHSLGAMLEMGYYKMPEYFPVWSKIMMPAAGAPPAMFYYFSWSFGLITAFFIVLFFALICESVPGKGAKKGLIYGLFLFLLISLGTCLSLFLLINLPLGLIVSWGLQGLIICLLNGMIIAKLV